MPLKLTSTQKQKLNSSVSKIIGTNGTLQNLDFIETSTQELSDDQFDILVAILAHTHQFKTQCIATIEFNNFKIHQGLTTSLSQIFQSSVESFTMLLLNSLKFFLNNDFLKIDQDKKEINVAVKYHFIAQPVFDLRTSSVINSAPIATPSSIFSQQTPSITDFASFFNSSSTPMTTPRSEPLTSTTQNINNNVNVNTNSNRLMNLESTNPAIATQGNYDLVAATPAISDSTVNSNNEISTNTNSNKRSKTQSSSSKNKKMKKNDRAKDQDNVKISELKNELAEAKKRIEEQAKTIANLIESNNNLSKTIENLTQINATLVRSVTDRTPNTENRNNSNSNLFSNSNFTQRRL